MSVNTAVIVTTIEFKIKAFRKVVARNFFVSTMFFLTKKKYNDNEKNFNKKLIKKKIKIHQSKNMSDLEIFLEQHRSDGGITHTSTFPNGKYYISEEEISKFHYIYSKSIREKNVHCITELSNSSYMPLIVDIDLKDEIYTNVETDIKSLYTPEHVNDIVFCFLEILKIIIPDIVDNDLSCFLFEREGYFIRKNEKTYFKNGFHLHFPKIFLPRSQLEHVVIPKIKEKMDITMIELPMGLSVFTILDECLYRGKGKPWYMYGSTKPEATAPYACTKLFHGNGTMTTEWKEYLRREFPFVKDLYLTIVEFFSIRTQGKEMYFREIHQNILIDEKYMGKKSAPNENPPNEFQLRRTYKTTHSDNEMVDELLQLLPSKYYTDYNLWKEVGWILYNVYDGGCEGFHRWDAFSKQCPDKYNASEIRYEWGKMYTKNYTIGSLKHYAKLENKEGYNELVNKLIHKSYENSVSSNTHCDIADILFSKFSDIFICASMKPTVWYTFCDHIWKSSDDGVHLRKLISSDIVQRFHVMRQDIVECSQGKLEKELQTLRLELEQIQADLQHEQNYIKNLDPSVENDVRLRRQCRRKVEGLEDQVTSHEKAIREKEMEMDNLFNHAESDERNNKKDARFAKVTRIINSLKTTPFKKNVMVEASEKFLDEQFEDNANRDSWLVAFNNGVYDLKNNEFRDGRPSDYLTKKMTVNYRQDFTMDSPEVQLAKRFFVQIFPDEELRNYFLSVQSRIFVGRNTEKIMQVWTGEGDNGKSVTEDIFEKMLGPLCQKLPTESIVGKRTQSSAASPELERLGNGVRFVTLQEPNANDVVNTGILKELTGNDKFYARGLHKTPKDIHPMFKIVMICNKPPQISSDSQNDQALWNRMRLIEFQSLFPRDPSLVPATFEEQCEKKIFPRDPNFADKVPSMLEGVAYYLLHIYRELGDTQIREPLQVMVATDRYRKQNDIFREFLDEKVRVSMGSKLHLLTIYESFKEWYPTCYANGKLPSKKELKEYLVRIWSAPSDGKSSWNDYQIIHETIND